MLDFVRSLRLEQKLSPNRNVEIIWFYIFLPCLIGYLVLLTSFINSKPNIGIIEVLDNKFEKLIYDKIQPEIIAEGLNWAEGPLWVQDEAASQNYLMFSDTKLNRIYKWEDGKGMFTVGKTIYIESSGCKNYPQYCDSLNEPGSNAILRREKQENIKDSLDLIVCQHGERAITLIRENGTRSAIATHYKGKRFNSPNDLIYSPEGHIYFTDPHYGLYNKSMKIVGKELPNSGVYFIKSDFVKEAIRSGIPTNYTKLLVDNMDYPNGLAFSPDFAKLYVSNSNKRNPYWKVFDVADDGSLINGKVFVNGTILARSECKLLLNQNKTCDKIGVPDGLKVDIYGNVFTSGPGGVLVFSPEGKLIGRIRLDRIVTNLVFGADGILFARFSNRNKDTYKIEALYVYPIKSCGGFQVQKSIIEKTGLKYDRIMMIVDENGKFVSQRSQPKMSLIRVTIDNNSLGDFLEVNAPNMETLRIQIHGALNKNVIKVAVWSDECDASEYENEAISDWFTTFLQKKVRLVKMLDSFIRPTDRRFAPNNQTGFSDGYPFLLASTSSLELLNSKLDFPIEMLRFRPNIVVSGNKPFAEDYWDEILINGKTNQFKMKAVKPCSRCTIPQLNPFTGEKDPQNQPAVAMKEFRTGHTMGLSGNPKWEKELFFGQNLVQEAEAIQKLIAVGDEVKVLTLRKILSFGENDKLSIN